MAVLDHDAAHRLAQAAGPMMQSPLVINCPHGTGERSGHATPQQAETCKQQEHRKPSRAAATVVLLLLATRGVTGHGIAREAVAKDRAVAATAGTGGDADEYAGRRLEQSARRQRALLAVETVETRKTGSRPVD